MAYTAIDDPEAYFQVVTWTGNATDDRTITLPADTDMQPDMVWAKERSSTSGHIIVDAVRGATNFIQSHNTTAEDTNADIMQSFETDGFEIGTHGAINEDTETYVAWCWKETADAGFDIVSYTGTGSNATVSHGLSTSPSTIIVKDRDGARNWTVYHKSVGATKWLQLDDTSAEQTGSAMWQDTDPTSSVFSIGTYAQINTSSSKYIAYCFADVQGFSKFGSYVGNSSTDGTFVYTGFSPSFLMIKCTSGTEEWWTWDNKRDTYNVVDEALHANSSDAVEDSDSLDFLSNGFKMRVNSGARNATGSTYIYMAFAEAPFVNSNGVPCNAR